MDSANGEEIVGNGMYGMDSSSQQQQRGGDPCCCSPSNLLSASQTLKSLKNTSLTIFNLRTPCDPLPGSHIVVVSQQEDLERRHDLARAILQHATTVRGDFETKKKFYHLALLEYYKLLRVDLKYADAIESAVLLLAILSYDEQCLGLIDYYFTKRCMEDNDNTLTEPQDDDKPLEWIFGSLPRDQAHLLEQRLGDLEGQKQKWCTTGFWMPLFLIALRSSDSLQSARIGSRIEKYCNLPFLCGLFADSRNEWTMEDARLLFPGYNFWIILKECVEDTLHSALQDTITHMENVLNQPPIQEQQFINATSLRDLFSMDNHQAGKLNCIHCRQRLSSPMDSSSGYPRAMRCSRCCVVHYCSRTCQKENFSLHKVRCKNIANLSKKLQDACTDIDMETKARQQYDLAYSIVDMAYVSTDTIDRGRRIYDRALMEYYHLLELNFHCVGALESTLVLLAILGYDDQMLGLMDYVLHRLQDYPAEKISIRHNDDERLLEWTQGARSFQRKTLNRNIQKIHLLRDTQWGANNFLLPLLISSTKKATKQRKEDQYSICLQESAVIARKIEEFTTLSVLRGLLPDSIQRWTENEASELLCRDTKSKKKKHWSESCLLFWEILKDTIALTPKLAEVLENTMQAMEESLHCSAHPEAPNDLSGYAEWSQGFGNN